MKPKKALDIAIKVLYVMPAILWCTVALLLLLISGGRDMVSFFWVYPILPLIAAVLLWKGKWWGCLPGIFMGILMFTQVQNEQVSGLRYCVYFAVMGILCYVTSRRKGETE